MAVERQINCPSTGKSQYPYGETGMSASGVLRACRQVVQRPSAERGCGPRECRLFRGSGGEGVGGHHRHVV